MIEQRIRARVGAYSVPAVVHAVQGDTGRVFVFELEDYTITGAEGASLNCQRPDKSFFTYAGTVSAEDNTVTVALDVEGGALTQEGVVTFQLELTEAGLIVCTFRGSIIVEPVVGGEATQEEKDFRDAIQAQLNNKASNAQLAQVESDLTDRINGVSDDLAQEILDRTAADATKANKSTTINGKSLAEDRVIYAQDIPSKNLLPNTASTTTTNGITLTVNSDGSISTSGTATSGIQFTIGSLTLKSGTQYAFSGCPSGGDLGSYFINFSGVVNDTGNGATATPASDVTTNAVINIVSGTNMNGLTFRPMIRLASIEDAEYVPYAKTNVELTKESTVIQKTYANTNVKAFALKARRQGNVVYIASPQDSKAMSAGTTTFVTLDAEFRPTQENVTVPIANMSDGSFVTILTTGAVIIYHPTAVSAASNNCAFSAVYIVD